MPSQTEPSSLLWVEGEHDQHVIWAICEKHHLPEKFVLKRAKQSGQKADSWQTLLKAWQMQLKGDLADVPAIGLVIDGDDDPLTRWRELGNIVQRVQLSYVWPSIPQAGGTIIAAPHADIPRLGVWLMPDNQATGALEDFLRFLLPPSDPLAPLADKTLAEIEQAGLRRYDNRAKAFLHTWLAWQTRPRPMGQAIKENALLATAPMAQIFVAWLKQLFEA